MSTLEASSAVNIQQSSWDQIGVQMKEVFTSAFGAKDVYVDSLEREFNRSNSVWYTIENERQVITGWLQAIINNESQESYLAMIAVHSNSQKQGLATQLIKAYIQDIHRRGIMIIRSKVRTNTLLPLMENRFKIECFGTKSFDLIDRHWYQTITMSVEKNIE